MNVERSDHRCDELLNSILLADSRNINALILASRLSDSNGNCRRIRVVEADGNDNEPPK